MAGSAVVVDSGQGGTPPCRTAWSQPRLVCTTLDTWSPVTTDTGHWDTHTHLKLKHFSIRTIVISMTAVWTGAEDLSDHVNVIKAVIMAGGAQDRC